MIIVLIISVLFLYLVANMVLFFLNENFYQFFVFNFKLLLFKNDKTIVFCYCSSDLTFPNIRFIPNLKLKFWALKIFIAKILSVSK